LTRFSRALSCGFLESELFASKTETNKLLYGVLFFCFSPHYIYKGVQIGKFMRYIFHAVLPNEREVFLMEDSTVQAANSSFAIPRGGSEGLEEAQVHLKDDTDLVPSESKSAVTVSSLVKGVRHNGSEEVKSFDEIGALYGFEYANRLVVEHEKDLRTMLVSWGVDKDIFPAAGSLGIEEMLINGDINPKLELRDIDSVLGAGLFALKDIAAGEFIGEYVGLMRQAVTKPSGYALNFPSGGEAREVDGKHIANLMRFCNHSRNMNCDFKGVWLDTCAHVCIFASERVKKGEELRVNYSPSYWVGREDEEIVT
jgi:hypothetical protein